MNILNAMTVDVEEHFQVSAFEGVVRREDWESIPSRVEVNTQRVLDLLDDVGVRATFFVLGWIGERFPRLVRGIADRGHEIASHGHSHKLAYRQPPEEFRRETLYSRRVLQDASGQPIRGYRAASFSIGRGNLWALDIIAEAGFRYDSSIYPVVHDRYGMPGAPRRIHRVITPGGGELVEVPPSCIAWGRATLPVCGGGYLRLYPAALTRWSIDRMNRRAGIPAIVYVHPWELDPGQPRIRGPMVSRFRHYSRLRSTEPKLRDLMSRYDFGPVQRVIEEDRLLKREPPRRVAT